MNNHPQHKPSGYPLENQQILKTIISNIPAMVFYKDLESVYITANEMFCHQLKTTPAAISGKTDYDFYHRELADRYRNSDLSVINSGSMMEEFEEEIDVDGIRRTFSTKKVLFRDETGEPHGIIGLAYDVTRQKQMERDLQSLDQRNRAIIKALPDLMFLFDKKGNFMEYYASETDDLISEPENISGKNVSHFFGATISDDTKKAIKDCLTTDSIISFEYTITKDKVSKYYEARFIKVGDERVLCISRNITDRIRLQHDLIRAKEKAEVSSRLKSTLLNNMSHELRTPLNGIIGFAEILKNELSSPDQVEMALHIHDSGRRLLKTLDSIMMLSQLESGNANLKQDQIDVGKELSGIMNMFRDLATHKGLAFSLGEIKTSSGYLDRYFFNESVSNIIDNAIKFTRKGEVKVNARIGKDKGSRHLFIKIEDTGIGISSNHLKFIFEEFRQVSEGQKRSFEGPGLGLTIAIKMVQLLGGDVVVESTPGLGSVFTIIFPIPQKPLLKYKF